MKRLVIAAVLAATASLTTAASLTPASYNMHNGHGVGSSGRFNYWDKEYNGAGCTVCDNDMLSGGTGNLTDGVVTPLNWFNVENAAGTGPYVGWRHEILPDPGVLFLFDHPVDIDTIAIHADDSGGAGGVSLPSTIVIGAPGFAGAFAVVDPDPGFGPSWLVFDKLGIHDTIFVNVLLGYGNEWVFVDEIAFAGPVPEASTLVSMSLGLAAIAGVAARRPRPVG